jgi:Ca2+-binding EF-hand superfamily protein
MEEYNWSNINYWIDMSGRKVTEKDSPMIIEKIFSVFDKDNNGRFTRQ